MAFQDSSKNSVLYYYLAPSVPPPPPPPLKNKIPREGVAEDFPLLFRSQKLLQGPCMTIEEEFGKLEIQIQILSKMKSSSIIYSRERI